MSKKINHDVLFDNGIDVVTRRLFLNDGVDELMYNKALAGLAYLNTMRVDEPITIVLNTCGGDINYAFAIYDLIRMNPTTVNILVNGHCMSAGVLILQAATERAATPSSDFMIHYGSQWNDGDWTKVERAVDFYKKVRDRHFNVLLERSLLSKKQLHKYMEEDFFFNAEDALAAGFIDRIVI
jgi:ATP-dependent Clp protease protease subunit